MLTIDGSQGEGGGQILRTALALSVSTRRPFRIENIRANRDKPGLRRQHLAAVNSADRICRANVEGAGLGSDELTFEPGHLQPGEYTLDIGSAGSTTLVLQTLLPPLLLADAPSQLILMGGTHNPHAPPLDFLEQVFLPIVNRMGPHVAIELDRPGFYPAGGGRVRVTIEPAAELHAVHLTERGALVSRTCRAAVARLPRHIAERELARVKDLTAWEPECFEVHEWPAEYGPGNILTLHVETEHAAELCTGFGIRGVPAEVVAEGAVAELNRYLSSGAPVGEHLADQLLLPLALAGGGSFVTLPLSLHSTTNMEVIRLFLDVEFATRQLDGDRWLVEVAIGGQSH
ncbi:MAG: RNA 3'-terminal phosphate cyclase [Planctomycetes bacterium]|nr:RNA 3'-terminal phosphate cyclase [Planctomycetota bacterium]